jgi:hypothetical protein
MANDIVQSELLQRLGRWQRRTDRRATQPLMRPRRVMIGQPRREDVPHVLFAKDEEPIERLS